MPIFAFNHCRDVVAAVTRSGGPGVLGAACKAAEELEIDLAWIDKQVDGCPYGVDLLLPSKTALTESGTEVRPDLVHGVTAVHQFADRLLEEFGAPPIAEHLARDLWQTHSRWTEARESAEAPSVLPMPLQRMVTSEAQYRANHTAADASSGAYELATYFVGQVVGRMTRRSHCSDIIMNMSTEYIQTCEQMGLLVDEL